jgi:hypothetical protein
VNEINPDIVCFQEVLINFDENAFEKFKSKKIIENIIKDEFKYSFFGAVWLTDKMLMNNEVYLDFNGFLEQ